KFGERAGAVKPPPTAAAAMTGEVTRQSRALRGFLAKNVQCKRQRRRAREPGKFSSGSSVRAYDLPVAGTETRDPGVQSSLTRRARSSRRVRLSGRPGVGAR